MSKNTTPSYAEVAIARPVYGTFHYRIPELWPTPQPGDVVKAPFGRGKFETGVVISVQAVAPDGVPLEKIKFLEARGLENSSLPPGLVSLCKFASRYYFGAIGECFSMATIPSPFALKKGKLNEKIPKVAGPTVTLREEQRLASELVLSKPEGVLLLEGVTGSGKTEVYLEAARTLIAQGKSVLFLVPEIALTPQFEQRIEARLGVKIAVWHSGVAEGKKQAQWLAMRTGKIRACVGARSALFAPLENLGLIVVDEEHEQTYKQEDRVRYHARDLAIYRGRLEKARVVLGSATPSLESLENSNQKKYEYAAMKDKDSGHGEATVQIIDLKKSMIVPNIRSALAKRTVEEIQTTLDAGDQVLIYLNRRGYAAYTQCDDCGEVEQCPSCSVSLTLYKRTQNMKCHACGFERKISDQCTSCSGFNLSPRGFGTEALEDELPGILRGAIPLRLDRDILTSQKRVEAALELFRTGKANLLMGTQMVVKGHDFPNVALVVVVGADSLFHWPDFRARERAFSVLTQVSGRTARGSKPGKVIIQTYDPKHPVLQTLIGKTTKTEFLSEELGLREGLNYPPFSRLLRIHCESKDFSVVSSFIQKMAEELRRTEPAMAGTLQVLGPVPSFIERVEQKHRFEILLKSKEVPLLQKIGSIALARIQDEKSIEGFLDQDPSSF